MAKKKRMMRIDFYCDASEVGRLNDRIRKLGGHIAKQRVVDEAEAAAAFGALDEARAALRSVGYRGTIVMNVDGGLAFGVNSQP